MYKLQHVLNILDINRNDIDRLVRRGIVSFDKGSGGRWVFTDEDIERIKYALTLITTDQLSEMSGCTKPQIWNWREEGLIEYTVYGGREALYDRSQIEVAKRIKRERDNSVELYFTEEQIKYIIERFPYDGASKIVEHFGIEDVNSIYRSRVRAIALRNGARIIKHCDVNHNFFDDMHDEYSVYTYGLIVTDGTVHYFFNEESNVVGDSWDITLNERDIDVLEQIKFHMRYLPDLQKGRARERHTASILAHSPKQTEKLYELGVIMRKSYIDISNIWIPEDRERFGWFLRGFVDGDGSVRCSDPNNCLPGMRGKYYGSISICQGLKNENLLLRIQSILKERYGILGKFSKSDHACDISYNGIDFKKFFELIYNKPKIYMNRKYFKGIKAYKNQDYSNYVDWGSVYLRFRNMLVERGVEYFDFYNFNAEVEAKKIGMNGSSLRQFLTDEGMYVPLKDNKYYNDRRNRIVEYAKNEMKRLGVSKLDKYCISPKEVGQLLGYEGKRIVSVLQKEGLYESTKDRKIREQKESI